MWCHQGEKGSWVRGNIQEGWKLQGPEVEEAWYPAGSALQKELVWQKTQAEIAKRHLEICQQWQFCELNKWRFVVDLRHSIARCTKGSLRDKKCDLIVKTMDQDCDSTTNLVCDLRWGESFTSCTISLLRPLLFRWRGDWSSLAPTAGGCWQPCYTTQPTAALEKKGPSLDLLWGAGEGLWLTW